MYGCMNSYMSNFVSRAMSYFDSCYSNILLSKVCEVQEGFIRNDLIKEEVVNSCGE